MGLGRKRKSATTKKMLSCLLLNLVVTACFTVEDIVSRTLEK